ncbi:MAG: hypothetical protein EAX96_20875 [Candidatus Lokiarchaeota archaeon]|nr:hypothetical protein [Candidatus Lokiarchaeota archaeon]
MIKIKEEIELTITIKDKTFGEVLPINKRYYEEEKRDESAFWSEEFEKDGKGNVILKISQLEFGLNVEPNENTEIYEITYNNGYDCDDYNSDKAYFTKEEYVKALGLKAKLIDEEINQMKDYQYKILAKMTKLKEI